MKKLMTIFSMAALLLLGSCAKPAEEFIHDDCEITSIEIANYNQPISYTLPGIIDQENGKIEFPIPKNKKEFFDLTKLYVRANVPFDAIITPSLTGLKDLSQEMTITVTAQMTGKTKEYKMLAYWSREYD